MQDQRIDVLIAGAGFAGAALAVALRQALGASLTVMIADPALARAAAATPTNGTPRREDPRATAIAAAARKLFAAIGVWERVADSAQPILDMAITDSRLSDAVRPTFLTFAGEIEEGEPFAHMVENARLTTALNEAVRAEDVALHPAAVTGFEHAPARLSVQLSDGARIAPRLLVAADGANSRIRDMAGISVVGWSYPQSAIVTTVAHEREHHGRAVEHFLPGGPFAILPLRQRRCSIVWTEQSTEAQRIVALPDAEFHAELEQRFGLELGDIEAVGPRRAYRLGFSLARSFVAERIALIGDAAHVIHPIAGQGLNMGLRDVAALAQSITEAARLGLDIGGAGMLERYQRWRRFDSLSMGIATDGLNRLFSNRSDLLRVVRDFGIGVVERTPALKQLFIREAAGLTGDVPKLLRGEAL